MKIFLSEILKMNGVWGTIKNVRNACTSIYPHMLFLLNLMFLYVQFYSSAVEKI